MKKIIAAILLTAVICVTAVFLAFRDGAPPPDTVFINDAVQSAARSGSVTESVIILSGSLTDALGEMDEARRSRDNVLRFSLITAVCVFALLGVLLCLYFERSFYVPFRRLQKFAHRIAAGNLDIPLEMDKRNLFGAFTESFDIMRAELRTAKENEYHANLSKKELVASLSHDIKTPLASIMSAMDIMLVRARDEKEIRTIEAVNTKLEQINSLVTNMFHATLEELQALKVTPNEIQSSALPELIQNADYEARVLPYVMPSCIVTADSLRLQQVFDNVISNSYKYAKTDISINARIDGNHLIIDIQDCGSGVSEEEIPLLFGKFYRGKNAESSDGYGLGLYISNYFINEMGGKLHCENKSGGFAVVLALKLA